MARSMWRGAIQFGLVTIPVKLYLATEQGGIGFNLLHASCLNRIQMKVYCPYHDEVIQRSDTVRGYEYSKGQYVVVTEEDIDSVPLKTMRAIEIEMFVNASRDNTGTQFVKQAYYLEPEQIGAKAFYLLKSVLAEQNKSAICKIVLKDREQLAALNPFTNTMLLTTLHWPDEVRAVDELNLPEDQIEIKASEKKMAEQLVASMTGDFSADEYHDDYRQALMAVIERKVAGEKPEPAQRTEPTNITDLMAALEASVAAARSDRKAAKADAKADEKVTAIKAEGQGQGRAAPAPSQDGLTPRVVPGEQLDLSIPAVGVGERLPPRISPMQPSAGVGPFDDRDWLFEPWWPGVRALASVEDGHLVRLQAEGLADALTTFSDLADELPGRLMEDGVVLDGWLLALDDGGWLDSDLLRERLLGDRHAGRPAFVASDLLWSGGAAWHGRPFAARRERLEAVLLDGDRCVVSHALRGEGTLLAEALSRFGLAAISARRLDARYRFGAAVDSWLRIPVVPATRTERPRLALIQRLPLDEGG